MSRQEESSALPRDTRGNGRLDGAPPSEPAILGAAQSLTPSLDAVRCQGNAPDFHNGPAFGIYES
jgi:hypothetical protein